MTYSSGCGSQPFAGDLGQEGMKIAACEGPLKRRGGPLVMALESKKMLFEIGQRGEIIRREDFSLDNREIDFNLIEPTGVNRRVDEDYIRPFIAQTLDGFLTSMSGTVVHDPKDTASGFIGLQAHDFADESVDRSDAALDLAATEDLGAMNIPGCQVGPGAFAEVLVFDARRAVGCRRQRWLFPATGLNTRLFVCGDDVIIGVQWSALPDAVVKIEDGSSFVGKFGSRGKIQLRCFQGRRASLLSQRHRVAPLISATRPCEITC